MRRVLLVLAFWAMWLGAACHRAEPPPASSLSTFAELRAVKGEIRVQAPGEQARPPFFRERLVDGEEVRLEPGALAWMRRDAGATWLIDGPSSLLVARKAVRIARGRVFVDAGLGDPVVIETDRGRVELSDARASIDVSKDGAASVYVLRGSARVGDAARATAGEILKLGTGGKVTREPVVSWEDWTGGLATADPGAESAPFGIGTVGARKPGDRGQPRFALVIQRLDVKVTIDHDFALTEVDQTFVNPSGDVVEGIFSFRTPPQAVLEQFGVDRAGDLVWGRIRESAEAVQRYESNVYEGSQEEPALLTWAGAGIYKARLYPIRPGATRRVVTRYSEWLPRQGTRGERRLYVYPMAAEGARGSLPRIEELAVTIDLSRAAATSVRAGMGGTRDGDRVVVKAFDLVPQADLIVELFDQGMVDVVGYRARHRLDLEDVPVGHDSKLEKERAREEADYLAIPLHAPPAPDAKAGVDLAVVVDTSAATEPGALAIARSMASSLLSHLGPADRAALWAGDAILKPVAAGSGVLSRLSVDRRKAWLAGLASIERGGATDIGALLIEAASQLDPKRQTAVVYIGDGAPSVGELGSKALHERVARLPPQIRILAAAVGSQPNLALLEELSRGAPVESVHDAYAAARAALRMLEVAGRPAWLRQSIDLGPGVERLFPRDLSSMASDQSVLIVGRVTGAVPTELRLGSGKGSTRRLSVRWLEDEGDLRRRWGQNRMAKLMASGAGRASLVDVAERFGLVSPFTSLYVPTEREQAIEKSDGEDELDAKRGKLLRWKPWRALPGTLASMVPESVATRQAELAALPQALEADDKEGGTGTRAQGMPAAVPGRAKATGANKRYAVQGPKDDSDPHREREASLKEAEAFGSIGLLNSGAGGEPRDQAPAEEAPARPAPEPARPPVPTGAIAADASESTESPDGIGLGLGTVGHGAGFGAAPGRLGGAGGADPPKLRVGATTVNGRLPPGVVQRIVRQNYGRFRLCYEQGLARDPKLEGRVVARFVIDRDGAVARVTNGGSNLADAGVVSCVLAAFRPMTFPKPEGGVVNVVYPLMLSPGSSGGSPGPAPAPVAEAAKPALTPIGAVGHERRPCSPAADLPFSERTALWRERLQSAGSAELGFQVYRTALFGCEAADFRERAALLAIIVDRLPTIVDRVALWRALLAISPTAADAVYRFLLVRVRTAADLKALHQALGLERIDPDILEKLLGRARSPGERVSLLRGAAERFPDDTELALLVLDAYEDASDDANGRAWARRLRRRVDASSRVRTNVGEYYLRLAAKERGPEAVRDSEEARRTFGEIVEFAPEDPLARRRLGDLLRAHGWYGEALRQYQTLTELSPDDPSVPILLGVAAQGTGRVEEAVRWMEQAATAGAPDASSPVSRAARALASAFLGWARTDALRAGHQDEAKRLGVRAARLASDAPESETRFVLSWAHPELRPSLWMEARGSVVPAPDNLTLLGVAQGFSGEATPRMEIRLDPEDAAQAARLGAKVVLTAISKQGTSSERVARLEIGFRGPGGEPLERVALRLEDGELVPEGS